MKYKDDICKVIKKLLPSINNSRIHRKIRIYVNGLYGKLENAEFALSKIEEIISETKVYDASSEIEPEIYFYVDSFFAFLYSCFDVLAQILNQYFNLNQNEKNVYFKNIIKSRVIKRENLALYNELDRIVFRKRYFKNLEKYRNCSTHRRQIYIQREITRTAEPPGYSITAEITRITWIICDDPLMLKPSIIQKRPLYEYSFKICEDVKKDINTIIKFL